MDEKMTDRRMTMGADVVPYGWNARSQSSRMTTGSPAKMTQTQIYSPSSTVLDETSKTE
jgi:hypothetical protein